MSVTVEMAWLELIAAPGFKACLGPGYLKKTQPQGSETFVVPQYGSFHQEPHEILDGGPHNPRMIPMYS